MARSDRFVGARSGKRGWLALGLLALTAAGPACTPPVAVPAAFAGRIKALCGIHAPEDLRLMPDGRHIIVSETPGAIGQPGDFAVIDTRDDAVRPLPRVRDGGPDWGDPGCADPGPAGKFGPLGIQVGRRPDGAVQLVAVDDPPALDRIDFFQIERQGGGMVAAWRGCVTNPGPGMFNAVTARPGGGFYATVMFDHTLVYGPGGAILMAGVQKVLSGQPTGYVVAWTRGGGVRRLPGSDAAFNNGIQVSPDGRQIYIAAWTGHALLRYDVARAKVTGQAPVDFLPDNLVATSDGLILATGIGDARTWFACYVNRAAFCPNGFKVGAWNPRTNAVRDLIDVPAGVMPGGSVAVRVKDALYIGSFSGDRVVKVRLTDQEARMP